MNWTPSVILAAVALGLCICAIVKPAWPFIAIAGILLAVAIIVLGK